MGIMPFVKLDCGMLDSSIWCDKDSRDLFITALLMAEPHELEHPTMEINTRNLEHSGWMVPSGWYGLVRAAGSGIIRRCGMAMNRGMLALERLASPDLESRSKEFEGRRMVRINGGFIILNYDRYRAKDYTAAERMRKLRERRKQAVNNVNNVNNRSRNSYGVHRNVTQAEAEAEAYRGEGAPRTASHSKGKPSVLDIKDQIEACEKTMAEVKRLKEFGKDTPDDWSEFKIAKAKLKDLRHHMITRPL